MDVRTLIEILSRIEDQGAKVSIDGCDCAAEPTAVFIEQDGTVNIARGDTEYLYSNATRV